MLTIAHPSVLSFYLSQNHSSASGCRSEDPKWQCLELGLTLSFFTNYWTILTVACGCQWKCFKFNQCKDHLAKNSNDTQMPCCGLYLVSNEVLCGGGSLKVISWILANKRWRGGWILPSITPAGELSLQKNPRPGQSGDNKGGLRTAPLCVRTVDSCSVGQTVLCFASANVELNKLVLLFYQH